MEERRREIRLDKSLSISYKVHKGLLKSSSRSRNISVGGICLPVFQRFDPGIVLEMELKMPEYDKPILTLAEIIWIKDEPGNKQYPYKAGIKFVDIGSLGKNEIKKILNDHSS